MVNERNILALANNPFVVKMFYSFQVHFPFFFFFFFFFLMLFFLQDSEFLYLVMEYLSGGDCFSLLRVMGTLTEDQVSTHPYTHTYTSTHLHTET